MEEGRNAPNADARAWARHPHAFGFKDYDHAVCRYCRCRFKTVRVADALDRILGPLVFKPKDFKCAPPSAK